MTERLDQLGLDPIAALARVAQHAEAEGNLDLAERAWRGLLPYAGPRPTPPRNFPRPEKAPAAESLSLPETPQAAPAPAIELPSWWQPGRGR